MNISQQVILVAHCIDSTIRVLSKSSWPDVVQFRRKLKLYLLLIVARLRTRHAQCDFFAMNIFCISAYEQSVCQMGVENANTRTEHNFLKNFSNDVAQPKFISLLIT